MNPADVALFIDPFTRHFEKDRLFEQDARMATEAEDIIAPYIHFRRWFGERGIRVHTADLLERNEVRAPLNVLVSFGLQNRYKQFVGRDDVVLSAFFAFESPIVEPSIYTRLPEIADRFRRVYSFSDSDSLTPFTKRRVNVSHFDIPYPIDSVRENVWRREGRDFLVMMNHNKLPALTFNELYTERMRAVEFFARYREIDLYGSGWNEVPFQMGTTWKPATAQYLERFLRNQWERVSPDPLLRAARSVYRGTARSKIDTIGNYTFCVCFENAKLRGWITEKIFDCFVAGTVPVYWGADDVEQQIPQDCFIDMRRFEGYEDLRRFLKDLSPAHVHAYRTAAREFMSSSRFLPFRKQAFTDRLAEIVEQDTGLALRAAA